MARDRLDELRRDPDSATFAELRAAARATGFRLVRRVGTYWIYAHDDAEKVPALLFLDEGEALSAQARTLLSLVEAHRLAARDAHLLRGLRESSEPVEWPDMDVPRPRFPTVFLAAGLAAVPDLPGCIVQAANDREALAAIARVAVLLIETAQRLRREIPEPSSLPAVVEASGGRAPLRTNFADDYDGRVDYLSALGLECETEIAGLVNYWLETNPAPQSESVAAPRAQVALDDNPLSAALAVAPSARDRVASRRWRAEAWARFAEALRSLARSTVPRHDAPAAPGAPSHRR